MKLQRLSLDQQIEIYKSIRRAARPDADYFIMIGLAAAIAALGLLLNSAAVIIGAMLLAPLMAATPSPTPTALVCLSAFRRAGASSMPGAKELARQSSIAQRRPTMQGTKDGYRLDTLQVAFEVSRNDTLRLKSAYKADATNRPQDQREFIIKMMPLDAQTFAPLTDNWIDLGLIYPVHTDSRRAFHSEASQHILEEFTAAGITIASQTMAIVQFPRVLSKADQKLL